ncbi:MAG: hypothetical protein K2Q18_16235 [Bdellovibrionales bacterium]|nr:hypothetical protein [Bdellovibrionales bacterium]
MVRFCECVRAIIILCLLISPMAFGKSVSLKTIEVTVPTNYGALQAEIHFDERDLEIALKVKKIIEKDLIKVINYFQYVPAATVHFNVDPYTRLTNGNATPFPTPTINLYNFPASNSEHLIVLEDWMRGLVFHEFTHITHLDQTRGYLKFFRYFIGSVATIPTSVVPRWFVEGIAVWSESHLIDGGRLNNPLFRKELLIQFLRSEYCETIDCLDDPGVYPGGQLSYWAGGHFMEYLENKRPGTIKCMVEKNSQNIPFNLNYAFKNCAYGKPQELFTEFRESFIKNQPPISKESEAWGDKISNAFGSDDFQKGILVDGNTLFKVEKDRKREALTSYDLQENVNMMVSQFKYPISDLSGVTTVPDLEGRYLIIAFNEDLNFRGDNRTWKLVNSETLLIEGNLAFAHDPSYVIALGNNRYLTASFVDGKWVIERQRVEVGKKEAAEVEVLRRFGLEYNLTYFRKVGQKIFTKLNRGDLGSSLYVSDLTLETFYKIYDSKEYFDLPIVNESFFVLREKKESKLFEFGDKDFKKVNSSPIDKNLLSNITFAEVEDSRVLVLENRLKTKEMPLKESLGYLKKNLGKTSSLALTAATFQDNPSTNTVENTNAESFPKFYHLAPHYWFLTGGTSDNLTSWGATTSFSDPMSINVANISLLYYPDEKKGGGYLDFNHKFSSISDLWSVNGFFNHEYSKTDFSNYLNKTTEWQVGTRYSFLWKRWTFVPGVYVGKTDVDDFNSKRDTSNYGYRSVLAYNAYSFDDYFQSLVFQLKLQNDKPNIGTDYMNLQTIFAVEGRFHQDIVGGLKASYGKLGKSGFRNGVLYGGGSNNVSNSRWHEFYGLPYSNAYGNEIFTFRGYIDWNFWNIYRGFGLVPFYFKEAHLVLGREMLSADRIILDGRRYNDEIIHSFFIGPKVKMNIFYLVPVDVDMIFSMIQKPNGGNSNQVELLLNAGF